MIIQALMLSVLVSVSGAAAKKSPAKTRPPAEAEDPNVVKARELFTRAQGLYKQARYVEAIEKFEEAYAVRPHPVIYFNIAKCYEQLGETAKALRNYRDYLRLLPDAKDKDTVTDAIANLERRLRERGQQQLMVFTEPANARIVVDGKDLGTSPASVELVAGNHSLSVSAEGFESVDRTFVMQLSRAMEITIALKEKGKAPVVADAPRKEEEPKKVELTPTEPPPSPPPAVVVDDKRGPKHVGTFVLGGVAVASLGAGIGMGVASANNTKQLKGMTTPDQATAQNYANGARNLAIGSDVAYGVAAVSAITAVILLFVEK